MFDKNDTTWVCHVNFIWFYVQTHLWSQGKYPLFHQLVMEKCIPFTSKRQEKSGNLFSHRCSEPCVRNSIKGTMSFFDFAHLSWLFLVSINSKLIKIKQIRYKKLHGLKKGSSIGIHDTDKVKLIYSSHKLFNVEKNVLEF